MKRPPITVLAGVTLLFAGLIAWHLKSNSSRGIFRSRYQATTTFQIIPRIDVGLGGRPARLVQGTREWFEIEYSSIVRKQSLEKVATDLSLAIRWNLPFNDAVARLERIVSVKVVRDYDVVCVTAAGDDSAEAEAIAESIRETYTAWRIAADQDRIRRVSEQLGLLSHNNELTEKFRAELERHKSDNFTGVKVLEKVKSVAVD